MSRTDERRMIAPNQIQVIKIWQKQVGLDDDTYRQRLLDEYGVTSCTQMTFAQARHLIHAIVREGHVIPSSGGRKYGSGYKKRPARSRKAAVPRSAENVVRMASKEELEKINALAGLIEWRAENGLVRWMQKRFGFERVRTAEGAWLVIEGLKKMFENKMKKDFGERWWITIHQDTAIEVFILEHCPVRYRREMLLARRQANDVAR
jgi:hypothetical protein